MKAHANTPCGPGRMAAVAFAAALAAFVPERLMPGTRLTIVHLLAAEPRGAR